MFVFFFFFFCFNDPATTEVYTLSLHDALPISHIPGDIRYSSLISGKHHGEADDEEEVVYTDEEIKKAIRAGIEPSGESMDRTMPRWNISDEDMNDLLKYLKVLG